MHFNFHFSAVQVLWTLTFAALLVLLVVLLGRDRARRYPWFTASILLAALDMLAGRLLFGRLPMLTTNIVVIALGSLEVLAGFLVLVELARKAFKGATRRNWIVGVAALLVLGGVVLAVWKPWLPWQRLVANPRVAALNMLLVFASPRDTLWLMEGVGKGNLLMNTLAVLLAVLTVAFGRRFHAGWRSHTQQIVLGLSCAAIGWLSAQGTWQFLATTVQIHSREQYERILGLGDKLTNANRTVYLAVLVWWIVCLWFNEPGKTSTAAALAQVAPAAEEEAAPQESSAAAETK